MNTLFLVFAFSALSAYAAPSFDTSIPNFAQVTTGIYRGGRPGPTDMIYLSDLGVRTDIDLQGGDLLNPGLEGIVGWLEPGESADAIAGEKDLAGNLHITFYSEPLNSLAPIDSQEDTRIDQILSIMSDPAAQPVYVHCEHGKDRTGLLIALYRVKYQSWSVQEAYNEWVDSGHGSFNALFTGDLDDYYFSKAATLATVAAR